MYVLKQRTNAHLLIICCAGGVNVIVYVQKSWVKIDIPKICPILQQIFQIVERHAEKWFTVKIDI